MTLPDDTPDHSTDKESPMCPSPTPQSPTAPAPLDYQERRAALLDDPRFERYRTPRARRILSAILLGVFALEAVAIIAIDIWSLPPAVFSVVMLALVVALVFSLGALKASTRGIEELSPRVLDERQAQMRGDVFARSYRILVWVLAATAALLFVEQFDGWESPGWLPFVVVMTAIQLAVSLPTLVAALRVRV